MKISVKKAIILSIIILLDCLIPAILYLITKSKDWFITTPIICILIVFILFNIYTSKIATEKQKQKMGIKKRRTEEELNSLYEIKKFIILIFLVLLVLFFILAFGIYNII